MGRERRRDIVGGGRTKWGRATKGREDWWRMGNDWMGFDDRLAYLFSFSLFIRLFSDIPYSTLLLPPPSSFQVHFSHTLY